MEKRVLKIGQEIEFTEDFEIKKIISGQNVKVKKGDTAFVTSQGFAHHIKGDAKGMIQKLTDIELKDYDNDNIAKLIFRRLQAEYGIREFLDDYEIEEKDFIDSIYDVLSDILL